MRGSELLTSALAAAGAACGAGAFVVGKVAVAELAPVTVAWSLSSSSLACVPGGAAPAEAVTARVGPAGRDVLVCHRRLQHPVSESAQARAGGWGQ